jgi:hypothetical protein
VALGSREVAAQVKMSSMTTETSERGVGRWPRAGALFLVSGPADRVDCSIGTVMLPPIVVSYVHELRS